MTICVTRANCLIAFLPQFKPRFTCTRLFLGLGLSNQIENEQTFSQQCLLEPENFAFFKSWLLETGKDLIPTVLFQSQQTHIHADRQSWIVGNGLPKAFCGRQVQTSLCVVQYRPLKDFTCINPQKVFPSHSAFKGTSRARFRILHNLWKLLDNRACTGYRQPKLYIHMKDIYVWS